MRRKKEAKKNSKTSQLFSSEAIFGYKDVVKSNKELNFDITFLELVRPPKEYNAIFWRGIRLKTPNQGMAIVGRGGALEFTLNPLSITLHPVSDNFDDHNFNSVVYHSEADCYFFDDDKYQCLYSIDSCGRFVDLARFHTNFSRCHSMMVTSHMLLLVAKRQDISIIKVLSPRKISKIGSIVGDQFLQMIEIKKGVFAFMSELSIQIHSIEPNGETSLLSEIEMKTIAIYHIESKLYCICYLESSRFIVSFKNEYGADFCFVGVLQLDNNYKFESCMIRRLSNVPKIYDFCQINESSVLVSTEERVFALDVNEAGVEILEVPELEQFCHVWQFLLQDNTLLIWGSNNILGAFSIKSKKTDTFMEEEKEAN